MNRKTKYLALLLILPLLTVAVTTLPDADADKGDGKSCSKKNSGKTMSLSSVKIFYEDKKSLTQSIDFLMWY